MNHGVLGRLRLAVILDVVQGDDRSAGYLVAFLYLGIHVVKLVARVGLLCKRAFLNGDLRISLVDPCGSRVLLLILLYAVYLMNHGVLGRLRLAVILDGRYRNHNVFGDMLVAVGVIAIRIRHEGHPCAIDRHRGDLVAGIGCKHHIIAGPVVLHRGLVTIGHRTMPDDRTGHAVGAQLPLGRVNDRAGITADVRCYLRTPALKLIVFTLQRPFKNRCIVAFEQVIGRLVSENLFILNTIGVGHAVNLDRRFSDGVFSKCYILFEHTALKVQVDILVGKKFANICIVFLQPDLEMHFLLILANIADVPGQRITIISQLLIATYEVEFIRIDDVGHHSTRSCIDGAGNGLFQCSQNATQAGSAGSIVHAVGTDRFQIICLGFRKADADGHDSNAIVLQLFCNVCSIISVIRLAVGDEYDKLLLICALLQDTLRRLQTCGITCSVAMRGRKTVNRVCQNTAILRQLFRNVIYTGEVSQTDLNLASFRQ